ncbi:MAG: multicopper oxidase domain-containing protein [Corynebacterium sp.]|nr:multicopper oxidase domain-containing protein [Corynebacterium sp.]
MDKPTDTPADQPREKPQEHTGNSQASGRPQSLGMPTTGKLKQWDRRVWHRRASQPVTIWLALIVLAGLAHPFLPNRHWVLIHLFTLGAVTNSIILWSQHFTEKFLGQESPDSARPWQLKRIYILNVGIVITVIGQMCYFWPVTAVGSVVIGLIALIHAWSLYRQYSTADQGRRYAPGVLAYMAGCCCLPIGAFFGVLNATGLDFHLAHISVNVLGFLGFAAYGSLVLLFPTIWRTQSAGENVKPTLGFMALGVAVTLAGSLDHRAVIIRIGLVIYALAWIFAYRPWLKNIITVLKDPRDRVTFASLSVALAPLWLIGSIIWLATTDLKTMPTIALVVGFGAQLLIGVMSFLLPSTIGGGPGAVRAGLYAVNRWGIFRSTALNVGLAVWLMPVSSWLKIFMSLVSLVALALFIPFIKGAVSAQRAVLMKKAEAPEPIKRPAWGQATFALAVIAVVVALSGGAVGSKPETTQTAAVTPTGHTTEVTIHTDGMRFVPNVIQVPKGDRLVITLNNTDPNIHDLKLATGQETGRLSSNESATIDAGIIGSDVAGWCTIAGHRQHGMTLTITTTDTASNGVQPSDHYRDPSLAPADTSTTVHKVNFDISEIEDGRGWWTFNGQPMGPTLRGKVGDTFEVTVTNHGSITHSIDFHAGMVSPDNVMKSIQPGESLVYTFKAEHSGIWMYHCGTMPVSMHIAAGMFGAVIIDPPNLAPVDHEYVLVQSEVYGLNTTKDAPVDADKLKAGTPDAVVFNGYENQYDSHPITINHGETARFWLLDAGPNLSESFHIVGTQFHRVYKEGAYLLGDPAQPQTTGGSQSLDLLAAQGGFVEAAFPEAGTYTMVNHQFIDAERGAHGKIIVQ